MSEARQNMVVAPGEGREIRFGPNRIAVKVGPESGGRQFAIMESVFPPGAGPVPHRHGAYDEAFYVLEGEIEYRVGERRVTASPGTCVFAPAGEVHAFKNVGTDNARHLVVTAPLEALEMVEAWGRARPEQLAEILAKYDTELVEP